MNILEMVEMVPVELRVFLMAMLPFIELRGSIPFALFMGLSVESAFFMSFLGNIFPVIFILLFLDRVQCFLSKHFCFFNRFFTWLFKRTRQKHKLKFEKWKELALLILVAIPLPVTGAWTGSLCAFLFDIPIKKAFPLIALGVAIAGIIVTTAVLIFPEMLSLFIKS